jgi:hypothetical protein
MALSRRDFVFSSAAIGLGLGAGAGCETRAPLTDRPASPPPFDPPPNLAATPEGRLDRTAFQAQIGTNFHIGRDEGPTDLTLADLSDVTRRQTPLVHVAGEPDSDSFALLFHGDGTALPQETYEVDHATLGHFAVFIVPVGPARTPPRYEAVFNRI